MSESRLQFQRCTPPTGPICTTVSPNFYIRVSKFNSPIIQNYLFLYNIFLVITPASRIRTRVINFYLIQINLILSRRHGFFLPLMISGLNNDLKTRHLGDLQNNMSNLTSLTRARITPYEPFQRSTLTLKDL